MTVDHMPAALKEPLLVMLALGLVSATPPSAVAVEPETVSFDGSIMLGHPLTGLGGSASEVFGVCDPDHEVNGIDGVWFDVSEYAEFTLFELTMDADLDADVWFYDESCKPFDDYRGSTTEVGATESGEVVPGTHHVVVIGAEGSGDVTLTLIKPIPEEE